jgi:hypothetical protein
MKIYESAYTYFPFLYIYVIGTVFGSMYHSETTTWLHPYTIWAFTLLNTIVYYIHDSEYIVKHPVHRHIWRTVCLTIYGIMLNVVHNDMFRDFHIASHNWNMFVSLLYCMSVMASVYYLDWPWMSVLIHIIFGFVPMSTVWQINLYMYIVYTTLSIILMYRRIKVSSLNDMSYHTRPIINYFMYLRLHDLFVVVGAFQLYLEYYKSALPDKYANDEIKKMLSDQRKEIYKREDKTLPHP